MNRIVSSMLGMILLGTACTLALAQEDEAEKKGVVVGWATAKGGYWIEVKADGEEKGRKYYCGSNPVALKAVKSAEVGDRIRLEWRFQEVFRVVKIDVLKPARKDTK